MYLQMGNDSIRSGTTQHIPDKSYKNLFTILLPDYGTRKMRVEKSKTCLPSRKDSRETKSASHGRGQNK
jgi:hypothetical protein